uniref:Odorant receptor n=1 Tax=Protaetia brevitarsis TaxID=348688 RepID=A0A411HR51_PROBE|nr:odorant receptor [Protaetia brevitarsis]
MLNTFLLYRQQQKDTEDDKKIEQLGKRLQKAYAYALAVVLICFMTKPILVRQRILPSVGYVPCDIRATLACYLICYASHCFGGIYTVTCFISTDSLFWTFLCYGYLEIKYVKHNLLNLKINKGRGGDDPEVLEKISSLVQHHAQILTYLQKVNDTFAAMLVYQFVASLCTLGMALFCLTMEGFPPSLRITVMYSPYYLASAQQIFVYCLAGGIISNQSASVADAAYNSEWWSKHQPNTRKALSLIILRSQREVKITVGGLWILNLNTFCAIVKAAMTMLTFMKNLYGRE